MNNYYCLNCGKRIDSNFAFKEKGGDFFHYRVITPGKPEVMRCGPVDCFEEDVAENRKEEMDESEVDT